MKQSPTMQATVSGVPTAVATPSALTDAQLYRQCKYYGKQAKDWMRKFESLLPEVYKRRLYKRRGFAGIHEFAQKLAGMSRDKVDTILRLSNRLEDKPILKSLFESGETGYAAIERVSYRVTTENEAEWAEKIQTLPKAQLEIEIKKSFPKPEESLPGQTFEPEKRTKLSFWADDETEHQLLALQREIEKERGEKLSFGEVMQILIKREHAELIEKAQKKRTINYCPDCVKKRADEAAAKSEAARAVPAGIRYTVLARQNYRCVGGDLDTLACGGEVDGSDTARATNSSDGLCTHPPAELHHLDGWALTKNHNPDRMRYLCKKHHTEVHTGDLRVQAYRSG